MVMEIVEYLVVMGLSAFKVMFGVASAVSFDMEFSEVWFTVALGGVLGIAVYAFLGNEVRRWIHQRRKASGSIRHLTAKQFRRLRFIVRLWKRFGIVGIAVLTPPLLTPPIGTAIALSFGEKAPKVILYLGVSMVAWSLVFALFGDQLAQLIHPAA